MKLPKNFLIGASTAAHQVEGSNVYSDLWAMEHMVHTTYAEPSLEAVDHYNRFQDDISMMAASGLNAYRFSIEWARIEPEKGVFREQEVEHYRQVIKCCYEHGVEPIVTLHHFSSPKWLMGEGGWEADTTPDYFARYVRFVMERLGNQLHYVCTINEANMGRQIMSIVKRTLVQLSVNQGIDVESAEGKIQMGINLKQMMAGNKETREENLEVFGVENPATFQYPRTEHGDEIIQLAHIKAREVVRELCPNVKVGLTLSLHDLQSVDGGEEFAEKEWSEEFLSYLPTIKEDDFIGIQNYTRERYSRHGEMPLPEGAEQTQMGYEYYPEGLEHVIRKVHAVFGGELLVTENGIATGDDSRRVDYIAKALAGVEACIADGLPVKAYLHWSLLDNFEWQKGYAMTFGLVAVDRSTQERIPKPSLKYLGSYRR